MTVSAKKLVVVSNRGPASLIEAPDGTLEVRPGAGGLAPSLARALQGADALWVAAAMNDAERRAAREGIPAQVAKGIDLHLVDLERPVMDGAYRVIANATLWFVLHGLFDRSRRPILDRHWHEAFEQYREYNRRFAEAVAAGAAEGATVVVNDYHLFLSGRYLASARPDLSSVHFTHTPFPAPEELAVLPRAIATELVEGLAAFGACGFHTERWAAQFRRCAAALDVDPPPVFVAALGTDAEALRREALRPEVEASKTALEQRVGDRRLLLRSDRVELSKNILRGFLAFEELLAVEPTWRGRVLFVAHTYPSRSDLPEYLAYQAEIEHLVERINARFAGAEGPPIALEVEDDFPASLAALSRYDVLLVNPIRDGMNLVAKEGPVLNERGGVLALSCEAGAFAELGRVALEVEPFDVSGTAKVLARALTLPAPERERRAHDLRALAAARPPARWLEEVVHAARPSRRRA